MKNLFPEQPKFRYDNLVGHKHKPAVENDFSNLPENLTDLISNISRQFLLIIPLEQMILRKAKFQQVLWAWKSPKTSAARLERPWRMETSV